MDRARGVRLAKIGSPHVHGLARDTDRASRMERVVEEGRQVASGCGLEHGIVQRLAEGQGMGAKLFRFRVAIDYVARHAQGHRHPAEPATVIDLTGEGFGLEPHPAGSLVVTQ